jgi:cytochrome c biogenesis protein CcdA
MKKILSLISILALSFSMAIAAEPINYDAQNIESEFDQLNKIENFVQNNEGTTLDNLKSQNSELLSDIKIEADTASVVASSDLPAGIPAFWWGCVLTILGVVLVYVLTDKDNGQTKKALLGCLVSGGLYIIWWIVVASVGTGRFF